MTKTRAFRRSTKEARKPRGEKTKDLEEIKPVLLVKLEASVSGPKEGRKNLNKRKAIWGVP